MTPEQVIEEAKRELAKGGYYPPKTPDWSPYYWLGRLKAAEEMTSYDGVRRRNEQSGSDSPAR